MGLVEGWSFRMENPHGGPGHALNVTPSSISSPCIITLLRSALVIINRPEIEMGMDAGERGTKAGEARRRRRRRLDP